MTDVIEQQQIERLRQDALGAIDAASGTDELEQVRIAFLGRRAELPNLLRGISELPTERLGPVGKAANQAPRAIETALARRTTELAATELDDRLARDRVD